MEWTCSSPQPGLAEGHSTVGGLITWWLLWLCHHVTSKKKLRKGFWISLTLEMNIQNRQELSIMSLWSSSRGMLPCPKAAAWRCFTPKEMGGRWAVTPHEGWPWPPSKEILVWNVIPWSWQDNEKSIHRSNSIRESMCTVEQHTLCMLSQKTIFDASLSLLTSPKVTLLPVRCAHPSHSSCWLCFISQLGT